MEKSKLKINFSLRKNLGRVFFVLMAVMLITQSCKKDNDSPEPDPIVDDSLSISGPEDGLAIYINGKDSKEVTPTKILKKPGKYNISVFSGSKEKIYAKEVEVVEGEATTVEFTDTDVATREWKCLVVGFKSATDGVATYTYTNSEIDKVAGMILGELQFTEAASYNIMEWSVTTAYVDETIELNSGYVTASSFNAAYTAAKPGDYDLIVAIYQDGNDWGNWSAPETNINALSAKASFLSIPYVKSQNIDSDVAWWADHQTGFLMNPYLRTLTQEFYPSLGINMPPDKEDQQIVMWRAEQYGYEADPEGSWKPWYRDIIRGKVDGKYGIGPQALYGMSPRAYALNEIGE